MNRPEPILRVRDLKKYFPIKKGVMGRVVGHIRAVDGVSFDIHEGECLGLVGESGSGKTTVAKTILRALSPTAGSVLLRTDGENLDVARATRRQLDVVRRNAQMIFQDPYSSLNPRMTVFDTVAEPLLVHGMRSRRARESRVRELLRQVGLKEDHLRRYPHAFSGGQRQRIGIARALALHPKLIVADEPVSALDVSVQAQVLNLLQELQREHHLTYLFVSHDLGVVRHVSDRVAVMYVGRLVEVADVDALFSRPRHPYTEALLAAIPSAAPEPGRTRVRLAGEVADPSNPPPGCPFHPRCAYAEPICKQQAPELEAVAEGHLTRCHLARELSLKGAIPEG